VAQFKEKYTVVTRWFEHNLPFLDTYDCLSLPKILLNPRLLEKQHFLNYIGLLL